MGQTGFYIHVLYQNDECDYLFPRCIKNKSVEIYLSETELLTYPLYQERTAFLKKRVVTDKYGLGWITDQDDTSITVTFTEGPIMRYAYHDIPDGPVSTQELAALINEEERTKGAIREIVPEYYGGERYRSVEEMGCDADLLALKAEGCIAEKDYERGAVYYAIAFGLKPDGLMLKTWEALMHCAAPKLMIRNLYRAECISADQRDSLFNFIDGMILRQKLPNASLYLNEQISPEKCKFGSYRVKTAEAEEVFDALDADAAMDMMVSKVMRTKGIQYPKAIEEIISVERIA